MFKNRNYFIFMPNLQENNTQGIESPSRRKFLINSALGALASETISNLQATAKISAQKNQVQTNSRSFPENNLISLEAVNVAKEARKLGMVRAKDVIPNVLQRTAYARDDNFTNEQMYESDTSIWGKKETLLKIGKVDSALRQYGLRLILVDMYRPQSVANEFGKIAK